MPIAADTEASLRRSFELAQAADLIVTIGGASVGDHDLVAPVAAAWGWSSRFTKSAMRPGKPLMAGRLGQCAMIGLPGNPVSAMVCGTVFVTPMVRAMLGLGQNAAPRRQLPSRKICLPTARANITCAPVLMTARCTAETRQDSSLLSVLASANALLVRPPHDPAHKCGHPRSSDRHLKRLTQNKNVSRTKQDNRDKECTVLTKKQLDLLAFIHKRVQRDGVPPSFDEMKDALDLRSKSGIHRLITALEERGFIRRLAHRARAIEMVKLPDSMTGCRVSAACD